MLLVRMGMVDFWAVVEDFPLRGAVLTRQKTYCKIVE